MPESLLFIDIETTGLDQNAGHILEIGMARYDADDLTLISDFSSIVGTPESHEFLHSDGWLNGTEHALVRKMHDESGLNRVLANHLTLESVEAGRMFNLHVVLREAADWLQGQDLITEPRQPLCGSSVDFDRIWLVKHAPWFADLFHYRTIDVSAFQEYCKKIAPTAMELIIDAQSPAKRHRPLDDIADTVSLLRAMRETGLVP